MVTAKGKQNPKVWRKEEATITTDICTSLEMQQIKNMLRKYIKQIVVNFIFCTNTLKTWA